MSRTTLTLALLVVTLLAGCTAATAPGPSTGTPAPTTAPPTAGSPATGASPDEPPLDFDGADATLGPDERPHTVRLVNDGAATRNLTLTVAHDGVTVYEQSFRSFPNTTVLGQLDHVGNYTLTVTVADGGSVTETLATSSFDCNNSTTTVDLSTPDPTAETTSTEMACGTAEA